jgi:hypothetical protein
MLLSAILAAIACGDRQLSAPIAPEVGTALFAKAGPPAGAGPVQLLKRTKAIKSGLTTSAVIGPAGGEISIPKAGVTVSFAAGAVSKSTRITMTAIEGANVAYEFEPHGLTFAAPVVVRQDLQKTNAISDAALAASLQGSYFEGDLSASLIGPAGNYARVKESRKGKLKGANRYLEFSIEHFSGYLCSTGVTADISVEIAGR